MSMAGIGSAFPDETGSVNVKREPLPNSDVTLICPPRNSLIRQPGWRGIFVTPTTIPPLCRDIKDHPVLATAIDGQADAIVTSDSDIRADEALRFAMDGYGIRLWGINTLLAELRKRDKAE